MKRIITLLFIIFINYCSAHSQSKLSFGQHLANLKDLSNSYSTSENLNDTYKEKVYIHFSKDSYNIGDTIWSKVYVLNGNKLSSISKVVHLDIVNQVGGHQRMLLSVDNGMSASQILLTDSLYKAGTYLLKAYTRVMRNFDPDHFFSKVIHVGNNFRSENSINGEQKNVFLSHGFPSNEPLDPSSIKFFPEGGLMVSEIRSKVAVKATDKKGRGINLHGFIEDSKGEKVALFETTHSGMGVFAFTPKTDNNYVAVIEDGQKKRIKIPLDNIAREGLVLSVNKINSRSYFVRISKSAGIKNIDEVKLLIKSSGSLIQEIKLPIDTSSITFKLDYDQLADGINHIILLSGEDILLGERLIFADKRNDYSTKLDFDKQQYSKRDKVNVNLSVTKSDGSGIVGGYSLSVVKVTEMTLPEEKQLGINASVLLVSELLSKVEEPNYYFTETDERKLFDLDILLLTQSQKSFNQIQPISSSVQAAKLKPELGLHVSGRVTDLKDKPVPGASISFIATKQMLLLDTVADAEGSFSFENLYLSDSVEIILRARGPKQNSNVKITLDKEDDLQHNIVFNNFNTEMNIDSSAVNNNLTVQPNSIPRIIQGEILETVEINSKRKKEIQGVSS